MSRKDADNRDFIKGINYSKGTYALSGGQWGSSNPVTTRGKRPTDGPPIIVSSQPPGAFAFSDDIWKATYGASQDAWLSLLRGVKLKENIDNSNTNFTGNYAGIPRAANSTLYIKVDGVQQIQYVVSKNTVGAAKQATQFGNVEEVRSIGLRAPMHIAGWGKTIAMRPTDPNPLDVRENDNIHKLARETWKQGPLDLRWDERRGVWRAWNDLIADTESQNLGTFVFGTNPDASCGFPFLRGKLEDVWWVRRTDANSPILGDGNDTTKTAEVCTTLSHKLFDPNRKGAAPLWDVFIIHIGSNVACGGENTLIGSTANSPPVDNTELGQGTLEIRTTAIYHYSDTLGGPICFTATPVGNNEVAGRMKFINGAWCPTVSVSEIINNFGTGGAGLCANNQYAGHMTTLFDNSRNVTRQGVFKLQDLICEWNEEYTECIEEHIGWLASTDVILRGTIQNTIPNYLKIILNQLSNSILQSVHSALQFLADDVFRVLQIMAQSIRECLQQLELVCDINVVPPEVLAPFPVNVIVPSLPVSVPTAPQCDIESYSEWEFSNGEFIQVTLFDPCVPFPNFLSNSCVV